MGTRSLTRINTFEGAQHINMYRQFDGYPSGHGMDLFEFLKDMTIINGISGGQKAGTHANGAGCLAAQMVAHFKTKIGGIYLKPVSMDDCGQDFEYIVKVTEVDLRTNGSISITVLSYNGVLFEGDVAAFGQWCSEN